MRLMNEPTHPLNLMVKKRGMSHLSQLIESSCFRWKPLNLLSFKLTLRFHLRNLNSKVLHSYSKFPEFLINLFVKFQH